MAGRLQSEQVADFNRNARPTSSESARLAKLDDADLSDANLVGAEGLTQAQLDQVRCSSGATLPDGLMGVEHVKR